MPAAPDSRPLAVQAGEEAEIVPEFPFDAAIELPPEIGHADADVMFDEGACVLVPRKSRRFSTCGRAKTHAWPCRCPTWTFSPFSLSSFQTGMKAETRIAFSPFFTR